MTQVDGKVSITELKKRLAYAETLGNLYRDAFTTLLKHHTSGVDAVKPLISEISRVITEKKKLNL